MQASKICVYHAIPGNPAAGVYTDYSLHVVC
jgi:hypothetical protein